MKKIFSLMLCLLLVFAAFAIVSCNKDDDDDDGDGTSARFTLAVAKSNLESHGYTVSYANDEELSELEANFALFVEAEITIKAAIEAESGESYVDVYELASAEQAQALDSGVKGSSLASLAFTQAKDNYLIMASSQAAIQHALTAKNGGSGNGGSGLCVVTFKPENGESSFTQAVAAGSKLERPANPKKDGHMFSGWYNNGKLWSFSDPVTGDMTLEAQWIYNNVVIEYDPGQGLLQDDEWEIEIEKNSRFSDHPVPTHSNAGMMFEGWYLDRNCTEPLSNAHKFSENTVLYAKWIMQSQCVDGSYNHAYGAYYVFEDATCDTAAVTARDCTLCGTTLKFDDASSPALGHDWSDKKEAGFSFARECKRTGCGEKEYYDFIDITSDALGNDPATTVALTQGSGTLFGEERISCIVNGQWDEGNSAVFCGKGSKIVLTITLQSPTQMDRIYVKGRGSASFDILVQYDGDSDFVRVGGGAFISETENTKPAEERQIPFAAVDRAKTVNKVQIVMPTPSNGTDYWEEVGFFKLDGNIEDIETPSDDIIGNDPVNGKVTIEYDPGRGMLQDSEWEIKIDVGSKLTTHPTPTHSDPAMLFDGWYFDKAYTKPVTSSYEYERGFTLYAKWAQQSQCVDGTYNHEWGGYYVYSDATCEEAGVLAHDCIYCGTTVKMEDASAPAQGHNYGPITEQGFSFVQQCQASGCDSKKVSEFTDLTGAALGSSPTDCVELTKGEGWGDISCIVNGRWDESSPMAGKSGELIVTVTLAEATYMDRIYLKGRGTGVEFEIYVQYEGEGDLVRVGEGAFLTDEQNAAAQRQIPYAEVDNSKKVTKVQIVMPQSTHGQDNWEEIGFFKLP